MPILEIKNIFKEYLKGAKKVEALKNVSITIEKGEFLSIVGPSGSGKTTLLNIIGCLDIPTSGEIYYNSKNLGILSEKQLSDYRRDNIAFIFQSYNLIPVLTVLENVELPLVIEKKYTKNEIRKRAFEVIESVGLKELADRFPKELSGGQEQRVAIARALVKNPLLVLADEPTANLDSVSAEEVISLMEKMNKEHQTTFVFSTHDVRVQKHAKRVVTLKDGSIESDVWR
jgi:putative ABC transport system ATP-binding protein